MIEFGPTHIQLMPPILQIILIQSALFVVQWFMIGFLVTAGFALAKRLFKITFGEPKRRK